MTTFTREDYEMAAKAAGLRIEWIGDVAHDCTKIKKGAPAFKGPMWNPPEDDGDTARLECAIGLEVQWYDDDVLVGKLVPLGKEFFETHGGDKNKARRYATFRAAIAIGKSMP